MSEYSANFLWPYEDESLEQLGYGFANAKTEEYQKQQWDLLKNEYEQLQQRLDKIAELVKPREWGTYDNWHDKIIENIDKVYKLAKGEE